MSVITFEDCPSSQSKETLKPYNHSQNESRPITKFIDTSKPVLDSKLESDTKSSPPSVKPTGNTPRFGSGNKVESLKPLKQRPATLFTKFSDSLTEDQSPQMTDVTKEGGRSFEVYHTGTESPSLALLSPSQQRRVETGSAGSSPKRKPYSLKHPLISKKSPLFKKFGLGPGLIGQKNTNTLNVSTGENYTSEKAHSGRGVGLDMETEMMNIQNRTNLNQMIEKHGETKRPINMEANQFLNISLNNVDRSNENNSLNSGKKESNTPGGFLQGRASVEVYGSEPMLYSEPSGDWSSYASNVMKNKATNNVKENYPAIKIGGIESKSPQLYPLPGKTVIGNTRMLSANSSLVNTKHTKVYNEESFNQRIVLGHSRGLTAIDSRKKNSAYGKRIMSKNKTVITHTKDDSIEESFNLLEISAIVQETHEKDFLNFSKDDGILEYIDNDEVVLQKTKPNVSYISKQPAFAVKGKTEDRNGHKEINSTSLAHHFEAIEQASQNKGSFVQQFPFRFKPATKVLKEAKPQRAASHNPYLSGGKRVPSRSDDDSFTLQQYRQGESEKTGYYSNGNHDRNSSMYEISKQYQEKGLYHPEDNEPLEKLKQRRVESALTRPSNGYIGEYPREIGNNREISYQNAPKVQAQTPNSERSNLSPFPFVVSPSSKQATIDNLEDLERIYKRIYLQGKPNTSSAVTRTYIKNRRINVPTRMPNANNNSVGPSKTNITDLSVNNESSFGADLAEKKDSRKIIARPESGYPFNRGDNIGKLPVKPGEFNMQKMRDEIKKLQFKDQESQMKIAKLNMQLNSKNKEWEKKYEFLEYQWKHKLTQQKEYYEKSFGGSASKRPYTGKNGMDAV